MFLEQRTQLTSYRLIKLQEACLDTELYYFFRSITLSLRKSLLDCSKPMQVPYSFCHALAKQKVHGTYYQNVPPKSGVSKQCNLISQFAISSFLIYYLWT